MIYNLWSKVYAVELESPRFRLDVDKVDFKVKKPSSGNYSLATRFGKTALKQLQSDGYIVKKLNPVGEISLGVDPSLVTFDQMTKYAKIDLTASSYNVYYISLIQEYALKNNSGETAQDAINYYKEGKFLVIPNRNKGKLAAGLLFGNSSANSKNYEIKLKLIADSSQLQGQTYETIINFIMLPGY